MSLRRRGLLLGIVVGVALIAVLGIRADWSEFAQAIKRVDWFWVGAAGVLVAASISLRAWRWHVISSADGSALGAYWNATVIGYVGNAFYPGRAGEVLRVAALHHALRVPPGGMLATALADRVADVVVLSAAALYVAGSASANLSGEHLYRLLALLVFVPVAAFAVVVRFGERLTPLVSTLATPFPGAWKERIPRWYGQARESARSLSHPRILALALIMTAIAFVIDYGALWCVLRGFGWALPFEAAVVVGVAIAFGSLLPAAPGNLGLYQLACVLALALYGVNESAAFAYSIVAQGLTLAVIAALGAFVGIRYGIRAGAARK